MVLYANWDSENPGNLANIQAQVVKKARAQPRNSVEVNRGATAYESKHFDEVLKQVGVINSNLEGIITANEEDARLTAHDYEEIDAVERAVDAGREGGDPRLRSAYSAALSSAQSDAGSASVQASETSYSGLSDVSNPNERGSYQFGGPITTVLATNSEINKMRRPQLEAALRDIAYNYTPGQRVDELKTVLIRAKKLALVAKPGIPIGATPKLARTVSGSSRATEPLPEPRAELPGPQTRRQEAYVKGFEELPGSLSPAFALASLPEEVPAFPTPAARFPKTGKGKIGGAEFGYLHLYKSVVTILSAVANANDSLRRLDMRAVPEADFKSLRTATRRMNDLAKSTGTQNKLTERIAAPLKTLYAAIIQKLVTYPNAELGDLTGGRIYGGAGFMPANTTFTTPGQLGGVFDELPRRYM